MQGADALERAHSLKVIVFDKTGTLTKGTPSVVDHILITPQSVSLDEALHLAAAAEAGSEHPLGRAVLRFARSLLCADSGERVWFSPHPETCSAAFCMPLRWLM